MAIDKSIRQHYQGGKIADIFQKQRENIGGKFEGVKDVTSGLMGKAKTAKSSFTSNVDLGSMAKKAIQNKIQGVVLGKLGLSAINPYIGLASLLGNMFGFDFGKYTQGFMPGLKPGQTQAQYEAARELGQLGKRKDYMWDRMLTNKPYSQQNLINTINKIAKKTPYQHDLEGYVNQPSAINIAKAKIGMPEHLGDRGSIKETPTGLVNPIQQARDEVAAKEAVTTAKASPGQMAADRAAKNAAIQEAVSQQIGASRGNGGGGGGGYGGDPGGGAAGSPFARGGRIGKPLPGRNRYL